MAAGEYEIFATYAVPASGNNNQAVYRVLNETSWTDVVVDQQTSPQDVQSDEGTRWKALGQYQHAGGDLKVELSDRGGTNSQAVVADAVWVRPKATDNNYIEYLAGDLPIIISAPHGGYLAPTEIPDRTWGTFARDSQTQELARTIQAAVRATLGGNPHVVLNRLARSKLDANRDLDEAAQGNVLAEQAWYDFHGFIDSAKESVTTQFGSGLYIDLHGFGGSPIALGYLLSSSSFALSDAQLDNPVYVAQSSLHALADQSPLPFSALLRGSTSLGALLQNEGYDATPSPIYPNPALTDGYANGGYDTVRHGSRTEGTVSGLQIELPMTGIRDTAANRQAFAGAWARVVKAYMQEHFGFTITLGNDPPTITNLPDTTTNEDTGTAGIPFVVRDIETPVAALTVTAQSSNQSLVRDAKIAFSGTDANRTVTFMPEADQFGTTTITVTVNDGFITTTATFVLTVTAVNDAPVRTAGTLTPITVVEDSVNSTAIALSLSAATYGPGGGANEASQTLSYTLTAIPPCVQIFKTDGATPVLLNGTVTATEVQGLKYKTVADANGSGNLTWTVTDSGTPSQTLTEYLAITVTAINDLPVRTAGMLTPINVAEDSGNSVAVSLGLQGLAYGPGGGPDEAAQTLTYTLTTIPAAVQVFQFDGTTRVLANGTVTAAELSGLKYKTMPEANGSGNLTWTVTDHGTPAQTRTESLAITVTAVNDMPVRSAGTWAPITVAEDSANSMALSLGLSGLAYGPGGGADETNQTLTYTLTEIPAFVRLIKTDGTTRVTASQTVTAVELQGLKYQTVPNANGNGNVTWTVMDNVTPSRTLTETLPLTVTAINDLPVFTSGGAPSTLENATAVVILAATDVDLSVPAVMFRISGGDDRTQFEIVSDQLRFRTPPDYESPADADGDGIYLVQVTADDGGGGTMVQSLNVTVTDVNEFDPVLNDTTFSVAENSANGTLAGAVPATDADATKMFSYSITGGNTLGIFAINAAAGEIRVVDQTKLDREAVGSVLLTVRVSDGGPAPARTDTATVTVLIADVNEFDPVLNDATFGVAENAANGTLVGTLPATDADATKTFSYSITGGNTLGIFGINAVTGQLQVADPTKLDREAVASVVLTVQVSDGGPTPARFDTASVTIDVSDVNENLMWQSPQHPADVTSDAYISPLDVLTLINNINVSGVRNLTIASPATSPPPPYLDPTGEGWLTASDVLFVINDIDINGSRPLVANSGADGEYVDSLDATSVLGRDSQGSAARTPLIQLLSVQNGRTTAVESENQIVFWEQAERSSKMSAQLLGSLIRRSEKAPPREHPVYPRSTDQTRSSNGLWELCGETVELAEAISALALKAARVSGR